MKKRRANRSPRINWGPRWHALGTWVLCSVGASVVVVALKLFASCLAASKTVTLVQAAAGGDMHAVTVAVSMSAVGVYFDKRDKALLRWSKVSMWACCLTALLCAGLAALAFSPDAAANMETNCPGLSGVVSMVLLGIGIVVSSGHVVLSVKC